MRHTPLAVGSFMLGALSVFFIGNHSPTFLRSVFAQPELQQAWLQAVPKVPPLHNVFVSHDSHIGGQYGLDGIQTSSSLFSGVEFVYGGGAYTLSDSVIAGPTRIRLVGAAANTAQLLEALGFFGPSSVTTSPPAVVMNTPIEKTTKSTFKGDFVSPYDGKK